jgi:hypothetical protein
MSRRTRLSFIKFCHKLYLLHFSKPIENRPICRTVVKQKPTRIVELGLGTGQRTQKMLRLATRFSPKANIHYTGIDLFEARTGKDGPGMRLKDAHRSLQMSGVKIQLVPGDAFSALARTANSLPATDLIVISKCQDPQSLEKAWFYVPRMLHERSIILQENADGSGFQELAQKAIAEHIPQRRAA